MWLALYPYSIFLGVISLYVALNILKFDFVISNNILIILIVILGLLLAVFFMFIVPKRCRYIEKNINFNVMHKSITRILYVKLIHLPAYIIIILTIIGCVNPFLVLLGIYLLIVLLKCIHMTSKIIVDNCTNRINYKLNKIMKLFLCIPVVDIICACIIVRKY